MSRALAIALLLVACKSEQPPAPPPPPKPLLQIAAEIRGPASLVIGTREIALRVGDRWFDVVEGKPVENAETAAAIAQQLAKLGHEADIFLGATPILVTEEHHVADHVRPNGDRIRLLAGHAVEVVSIGSGSEFWRFERGLAPHLAFVGGPSVSEMKQLELIGPEVESMSPVSRRKCGYPQILDIDAGEFAYALVVECNAAVPIRLIEYQGIERPVREMRMPSPESLRFKPEVLAVHDKRIEVVGIREPDLLAVAKPDGSITTSFAGISRVLAAVIADDSLLWVLATAKDGTTTVLRDGKPVPLDGKRPIQLALDKHLGAVVLTADANAHYLLAERVTTPIVITPPR